MLLKLASQVEVVEATDRYLTDLDLGCLAQGTNASKEGKAFESPTKNTEFASLRSISGHGGVQS